MPCISLSCSVRPLNLTQRLTAKVCSQLCTAQPGLVAACQLTLSLLCCTGRGGLQHLRAAPVCAPTRRSPSLLTMMASEDKTVLQRAGHSMASLAVFLSLVMPAYIAPARVAAQAPSAPASEKKLDGGAKVEKQPMGKRGIEKASLSTDESVKKIQEKAELFGEILADLQDLYVDPVDLDKLAETGFQAMLNSLDPYTEFENVEAAKVMRTQTIGNYGGVGLVISKNKDSKGADLPYITVVNAFEGYAFDAGMLFRAPFSLAFFRVHSFSHAHTTSTNQTSGDAQQRRGCPPPPRARS